MLHEVHMQRLLKINIILLKTTATHDLNTKFVPCIIEEMTMDNKIIQSLVGRINRLVSLYIKNPLPLQSI